ncbi:transposase family protein [Streptococcus halotolerans]
MCPHCSGYRNTYDFSKTSTIPRLDIQGMPTVLRLKKRHF